MISDYMEKANFGDTGFAYTLSSSAALINAGFSIA